MRLVFLGPPGAGKGTIAAIAKESFHIVHISTGDLFRSAVKDGSDLGRRVQAILASGALVPDDLTIEMVRRRLAQDDCKGGFILDGFPRTIAQADALAGMAVLDAVVNFQITREEVVQRLSGRRVCRSTGRIYHIIYNPPKREGLDDDTGEPLVKRPDDEEEKILFRLSVYEKATAPLIDYYRRKGLLVDLDAGGKSQDIFERLRKTLQG